MTLLRALHHCLGKAEIASSNIHGDNYLLKAIPTCHFDSVVALAIATHIETESCLDCVEGNYHARIVPSKILVLELAKRNGEIREIRAGNKATEKLADNYS